MPIDHKPLEGVTEDDLLSLIADGVQEGLHIDYKRTLPGKEDRDKREFLSDVSSFANTAGGHLLLGVEEAAEPERQGTPSALCGITEPNIDQVKQRLSSLLQDGIRPRILGVQLRDIGLEDGAVVLVIRIPRSWAGPHMVCHQMSGRFYARNASGKYQLDVDELRAAFLRSETTSEQIRRFRLERLSRIEAGEAPVRLPEGPKIVFHAIPLSALGPGAQIDVNEVARNPGLMPPPNSGGWDHHHNFDGLVAYQRVDEEGMCFGYVQIFRTAAVETVMANVGFTREGREFLRPITYEGGIIRALRDYFGLCGHLQVAPPILVMLSLLSGRGYTMYVDPSRYSSRPSATIDRDALLVPEAMAEDLQAEPAQVLRPCFDALWNACGRAGSLNYGREGNWVGDERR